MDSGGNVRRPRDGNEAGAIEKALQALQQKNVGTLSTSDAGQPAWALEQLLKGNTVPVTGAEAKLSRTERRALYLKRRRVMRKELAAQRRAERGEA